MARLNFKSGPSRATQPGSAEKQCRWSVNVRSHCFSDDSAAVARLNFKSGPSQATQPLRPDHLVVRSRLSSGVGRYPIRTIDRGLFSAVE